MAQATYTPISLYHSTTAAAVPTAGNLVAGELALNISDMKLYAKNSGGTVTLLASNAASAPVLSFSAGTTGFTPNTATTGAVTLAGTLATTNGGTGLTSFTSGGVVFASSASVLATGSALTFDGSVLRNLQSSGTNAWFRATSGTVDTYFGAATSGLGTVGVVGTFSANDLTFYQNSAEGMRLTSTGLGIGTTAPATKLEVVESGTGSSSGVISATATSGGNAGYGFKTGGTLRWFIDTIGSAGSEALRFYSSSASAERMRLDASGNLGINITPSAWSAQFKAIQFGNAKYGTISQRNNSTSEFNLGWNVYNTSTGTSGSDGWVGLNTGDASSLYMLGGATHTWLVSNTAATANSAVTWTASMVFNSSGNLGIGTTSPSAKLDVSSTSDVGFALSNSSSVTSGNRGNIYMLNSSLSTVGLIRFGAVTDNVGTEIQFHTRPAAGSLTEFLRIASTGAFGLSGANYGTSGQVLTSSGSAAAPTWTTVSGGGSPGGSNTQVQYNSSGAFAGSANFTFGGTGISTGNVNVTSSTAPTAGMYYNSTATSGLSFYNTGVLGGSSIIQSYYGKSTIPATSNSVNNGEYQWLAFGSGATPKLTTIGSTASLYYMSGHGYLITDVPSVLRIDSGSRGDNTNYSCPEENGVIFINMDASYGGNAANDRAGMYIKQQQMGLGGSNTTGYKAKQEGYGSGAKCFWSLCKPNDPNGGGQPYGFYAQIDTSNGANDNSAPVGLVVDNATVDNYTKINGGAQLAIFYDRRSGSTSRTCIQFYRNTTGNSVGTITTTNSATAYNTSSDYRLKENIAPLTGAIEKVLRLKPSTYTWKLDGSVGEGFIAHELQEVIPQAVSGTKDEQKLQQVEVENAVAEVQDEDGNIVSYGKPPVYEEQMKPVYQGVDTSFLVATLTAAIQEQQAIIESLKARLDAANL